MSNTLLRDECEWNAITKKCQRKNNLYGLCSDNADENDCSRSLLGCAWVNNKCIETGYCALLSSSVCENLMSNTEFRGDCEWNQKTKKCQRKGNLYGLCRENLDENDCSRSLLGCAWVRITNKCQRLGYLYGLCSDNVDENDCSRSLLGCTWVNNECIMAQHCNSLSSSACENLISNTMLRGDCIWNKNDKICLKRNRLIRNLVEDEVTTKYYCSFNFPNIEKDKNYDLTLIDKNNNKTSISLSLIPSDSSIDESDNNNNFVIYKASDNFLKNNLLISLILILLFFMFNY